MAAVRPLGTAGCEHERALAASGYTAIAGVDEAGRGAWAGPLVAAAVVLPTPDDPALARLEGLRDSKQLTPEQRDAYYTLIRQTARAVGLGIVEPDLLDALGLGEAGRRAMAWAVQSLPLVPDFLLVDAYQVPLDLPQRGLIFGDCLSLSIAAASVVAKVTRDRLMDELHRLYPCYGFDRHKGYGTREHQQALARHGPCLQHRVSYGPIQALLTSLA